jgi:hypothetical protein
MQKNPENSAKCRKIFRSNSSSVFIASKFYPAKSHKKNSEPFDKCRKIQKFQKMLKKLKNAEIFRINSSCFLPSRESQKKSKKFR